MLCAQITTNGALQRSVSFSVALSSNTLSSTADSQDIELLNSGLVTFDSGSDTGAVQCAEVVAVNDTILEDDEDFEFVIVPENSSREALIITGGPVDITIIEHDDSKPPACNHFQTERFILLCLNLHISSYICSPKSAYLLERAAVQFLRPKGASPCESYNSPKVYLVTYKKRTIQAP